MKLHRRMKVSGDMTNATMSDIVFLLLIFFMATTIFKGDNGLSIRFPQAHPEVMSELGKENLTIIVWIKQAEPGNDDSELVARIGDFDIPLNQVTEQLSILSDRYWHEQNKRLDAVILNVDSRVPMASMVDLFSSMRYDEIYSIQFNTNELGLD